MDGEDKMLVLPNLEELKFMHLLLLLLLLLLMHFSSDGMHI
jgi:hypothetical protein